MINGKIIFREAVIAGKEQQPALEILTVDGDNGGTQFFLDRSRIF